MDCVIERIERATRDTDGCVLAFDADGTLWSGDVSDDVFLHCVENALLRPAARARLARLAEDYGVAHAEGTTSSELARLLFTGYQEGAVGEVDAFGMMAWCYAGFLPLELHELCQSVLTQAGIGERLNGDVLRILDWSRSHGIPAWVVSASPLPVLAAAIEPLGFSPSALVATVPAQEAGVIADRLAGTVPYENGKVTALRQRVGPAPLVATFGDSHFDLDLLRAATFGVAVEPKPALLAALADHPDIMILA